MHRWQIDLHDEGYTRLSFLPGYLLPRTFRERSGAEDRRWPPTPPSLVSLVRKCIRRSEVVALIGEISCRFCISENLHFMRWTSTRKLRWWASLRSLLNVRDDKMTNHPYFLTDWNPWIPATGGAALLRGMPSFPLEYHVNSYLHVLPKDGESRANLWFSVKITSEFLWPVYKLDFAKAHPRSINKPSVENQSWFFVLCQERSCHTHTWNCGRMSSIGKDAMHPITVFWDWQGIIMIDYLQKRFHNECAILLRMIWWKDH